MKENGIHGSQMRGNRFITSHTYQFRRDALKFAFRTDLVHFARPLPLFYLLHAIHGPQFDLPVQYAQWLQHHALFTEAPRRALLDLADHGGDLLSVVGLEEVLVLHVEVLVVRRDALPGQRVDLEIR